MSCSVCGRAPDVVTEGETPLGWTTDSDGRARSAPSSPAQLICPECTREYVRSIEAKLDRDWW